MEIKPSYEKLFVGGDLSGIQKFLYNITSRKAAVSLKGRSFYLRQFMENACSMMTDAVHKLDAKTEVIYCSGGKFYFIVDNRAGVVETIEQYAKELKQSLWHEHKGLLGLNVASEPFTEHDDGTVDVDGKERQPSGTLWRLVNASFNVQKNQKFKDLLVHQYADFFQPIVVGAKPKVCAVSGIESDDCVLMNFDEEGELYVLPSVKEQIELGEALRNQQHFRTFEEYAGDSYLGVLRMDVDGLGKRFIDGFRSIKDYQAFSKRLVDFFENETEQIQKEEKFRKYLNIIYAGGDDLFVVGRWDKVIDYAERIHKEVEKQFLKDGISISGGMIVMKPKYPISKAAEQSGRAEEQAKEFRDGEKNAFTFLGSTVSWKDEFAYVKSYQMQFVSLVKDYEMTKSILHKIMLYAEIAELNKRRHKEGKTEDFSYVWHISYYLTRYIKRNDVKKEVCDFCKNLRDHELSGAKGRNLQLLALAARWAEILLREIKQ